MNALLVTGTYSRQSGNYYPVQSARMKRCLSASTARLVIGKRASRQLERVGYSDRWLLVVPENGIIGKFIRARSGYSQALKAPKASPRAGRKPLAVC
jgi:hypothetical protein